MKVITVRNVHQALPEGCHQLWSHGIDRKSRNGLVRVLPEPLTTVYTRPWERVLFWEERDANPFFHLFEALWMIMGRNDLKFISAFNSNMGRYSDDGVTLNAAYGYRWRQHFRYDQLTEIANALSANPDCRRQVLSMWDAWGDLGSDSLDLPCNTHAYFQRDELGSLDMMVTNRSNDLIWGAYGANAVHFSVLQEYMAAKIGCDIGKYWQTSFNTHIYHDPHLSLMDSMAARAPQLPHQRACPYSTEQVSHHPMISISPTDWDRELREFIKTEKVDNLTDPFIIHVISPMWLAWKAFKTTVSKRHELALDILSNVTASDWRRVCSAWIIRKMDKVRYP